MKIKHFPWEWLLALVAGFGLGLAYAWVIAPAQYIDAEPHTLRDDFKDHFRTAIAAAYSSNADLERARARLALLGDPNPSQALTAQAQRMLATGASPDTVQQVALLASALEGQVTVISPTALTVNPNSSGVSILPINTAKTQTGTPESILATEPTSTPIPDLTATPKPSRTPTPTLGAPFQLVGQDTLCDQELAEGLLQIVVTNASRKQIPGIEIIIIWTGGEEHIFTGLKPELGHGYADYLMENDVIYSIHMADGGTPASDISSPGCTATDGNPYSGGVRITFQQP